MTLLSIVIPTRNRVTYAAATTAAILRQIPSQLIEVVVHDNSDSDELRSALSARIDDQRLKYFYIGHNSSMIDNFNLAISRASGEFVCLLGDDDGVNLEILSMAEWMALNGVDVLSGPSLLSYLWPGVGQSTGRLSSRSDGSLEIQDFRGAFYKINAPEEMARLMRDGGAYYLNYRLPKLYNGIVRRSVLDSINSRAGGYFHGLSPDISAVVALTLTPGNFIYIDYPISIPGACRGSGASYSRAQFGGPVRQSFLFRGREHYEWTDAVPSVYFAETIWADSALATLRAFGDSHLSAEWERDKLFAHCFARHKYAVRPLLKEWLRLTQDASFKRVLFTTRLCGYVALFSSQRFVKRAWNRALLLLKLRRIAVINELPDIEAASLALSAHLSRQGLSFGILAKRASEQAGSKG